MVYEDVNDIERNPMKYYAETLKNDLTCFEECLEETLPTIFIDCSPFTNIYNINLITKVNCPEFTLVFLFIDDCVKIPKNELDQISKNVGSGFTIFQNVEPNESMKSVAEVLKIKRYCAQNGHRGETQRHPIFLSTYLEGAFFESRKAKNSKSSSTKLDS